MSLTDETFVSLQSELLNEFSLTKENFSKFGEYFGDTSVGQWNVISFLKRTKDFMKDMPLIQKVTIDWDSIINNKNIERNMQQTNQYKPFCFTIISTTLPKIADKFFEKNLEKIPFKKIHLKCSPGLQNVEVKVIEDVLNLSWDFSHKKWVGFPTNVDEFFDTLSKSFGSISKESIEQVQKERKDVKQKKDEEFEKKFGYIKELPIVTKNHFVICGYCGVLLHPFGETAAEANKRKEAYANDKKCSNCKQTINSNCEVIDNTKILGTKWTAYCNCGATCRLLGNHDEIKDAYHDKSIWFSSDIVDTKKCSHCLQIHRNTTVTIKKYDNK